MAVEATHAVTTFRAHMQFTSLFRLKPNAKVGDYAFPSWIWKPPRYVTCYVSNNALWNTQIKGNRDESNNVRKPSGGAVPWEGQSVCSPAGPPDMMSVPEGEGGNGKADVVREVAWIFKDKSVPNVDMGEWVEKSKIFAGIISGSPKPWNELNIYFVSFIDSAASPV